MTQALRVALWVPVETPPEVGDGIVTKNSEQAQKVLPTRFVLGGGGGGGGIEEAPFDSKFYSRRNGGWSESPSGGGASGIEEAPVTGQPFARQDAGWVSLAIIDAGTY